MSSLVSRLWTRLCGRQAQLSIMIVGLDNSGKTSILNNLASLNRPSGQESLSSSSPQSQNATTATSGGSKSSDRLLASSSSSSVNSGHQQNRPAAANTKRLEGCSGGASVTTPTVGYNYERIQYRGLTLTVLDFSGQNRYRNLWQEFYNCIDAIVFVIDSSDLIRLVVVRDELETMLSHPYFTTLSCNDDSMSTTTSSSSAGATLERQVPAPIGAQKQLTISRGKLVQSPLDSSSCTISSALGKSASSSSSSSSSLLLSRSQRAGNAALGGQSRQQQSRRCRQRNKVPILFLANKSDLANSVDIDAIVKALNLSQLPKCRHPWFVQATSVNSKQGIGEGFDWLVGQLSGAEP